MAAAQNWLDASSTIPDDAQIAAHYKPSAKAQSTAPHGGQNTSTVEPYREEILA